MLIIASLLLLIGCATHPKLTPPAPQATINPSQPYSISDYSPYDEKAVKRCEFPRLPEEAKGLPILPSGLVIIPERFGFMGGLEWGPIVRYNTLVEDYRLRGCK